MNKIPENRQVYAKQITVFPSLARQEVANAKSHIQLLRNIKYHRICLTCCRRSNTNNEFGECRQIPTEEIKAEFEYVGAYETHTMAHLLHKMNK